MYKRVRDGVYLVSIQPAKYMDICVGEPKSNVLMWVQSECYENVIRASFMLDSGSRSGLDSQVLLKITTLYL